MNKVNSHRVGLVFGLFAAIVHAVWAILVWLGVAGPFIKWVLGLHFISEPITVMDFSLGNAILLIIVAFIVAYIVGRIFAALWNAIKK